MSYAEDWGLDMEPPEYFINKGEINMFKAVVTSALAEYKSKTGKISQRIGFKVDGVDKEQYLYKSPYNEDQLKSFVIGQQIDVKKNGGFWNLNQSSDEIFDDMKNPQDKPVNKNALTEKADLLRDCVKAMIGRLPDVPIEEQIKLGISLYISCK